MSFDVLHKTEMGERPTMKWKIWLVVLVTIGTGIWAVPDSKLRVVVCDVGQGDAILIQRGDTQMLVDGGPDEKVLQCLGRHMPFYDRRIEVVMLTHPEADHLAGLIDVVKRYTVLQFVSPVVGKQTSSYVRLMQEISHQAVQTQIVYAGDRIKLGEIKMNIVWPEKEWLSGKVLGMMTSKDEVNSYAVSGIVEYGKFRMLLTGDADAQIEPEELAAGRLETVDVLKVPHHGSKTGMTKEWLEAIRPKLAVISVGKNSYGHPTAEALSLLANVWARVLRTDQKGDIEIVSDGRMWSVSPTFSSLHAN